MHNDDVRNELTHHGILGMKWGIRRYQNEDGSYTSAGKKRYIADKTAGIQKDIDSFKNVKKGIYDKKGKLLVTPEEVKGNVEGLQKLLAKSKLKAARNWDVNVTKQQIDNLSTKMDKFVYNSATRKSAAKYVVDKNMSIQDAIHKAKKQAWINSGIAVAVSAGIQVAALATGLRD